MDYISHHFDTVNAGSKIECASFIKIASKLKLKPCQILFLTDNVKEYKASKESGMHVLLLNRPGNVPVSENEIQEFNLEIVNDFHQIQDKLLII